MTYAPTDPVVLQFPANKASHVYHGLFWPSGVPLGQCFWEAWCAPDTGSEYWISEGYGGGHAVLFGNLGVAGNMWDGTTITGFGSDFTCAVGEWTHQAVGWDGTYIYVYVNGVPVGRTSFTGPRQAQQGHLFIGGSDHSNFDGGKIAMVRGFEDAYPLQNGQHANAFRPERPFGRLAMAGTTPVVASFLAHYNTPGLIVRDQGAGYDGDFHPGVLNGGGLNLGMGHGTQMVEGWPKPAWTVDTTSPFAYDALVLPAESVPAAATVPSGSPKIWDDFNRANQTWAFQFAPSLGSTLATGSLGALAWAAYSLGNGTPDTTGKFGILQGRAVFLAVNSGLAFVANNSADMDARVTRRITNPAPRHQTGIAFRVTDSSNFLAVTTVAGDASSGTRVTLQSVTAGTVSTVATYTTTGSWTKLRVVTSGTTITVYTDDGGSGWTQIGQATGVIANQSATGVGLWAHNGDAWLTYDDFTVF